MKFNLNITDMSVDEFAELFAKINTNSVVVTTNNDDVHVDVTDVVEASDETINFDKDGLQWDERIHSSNKKLTAKGVWQRRKNITDEYYEQIKNELLGVAPVITTVTPMGEMSAVAAPEPVAPVVAPVTLSPELAAVNHTLYTSPQELAQVPPYAPAPEVDCATLYQTMFEKVRTGFASKILDANYIQNMVNTMNATLNSNYKGLAEIKDNSEALKFVINDMVAKGL